MDRMDAKPPARRRLRVGDPVTILPPYDGLPYILEFQHYGHVAELDGDEFMVELESTFPPRQRFGPFPPAKLAHGWRDQAGQWRVKT